VAAAIAFGVHSGFDLSWQVPAIALTVAAIVGLVIGEPLVQRHESPDSAAPGG
jgi:membrane protein implicated in regulation of membrane protease activity